MRPGFTLHEMLISLTVMSVVFALAAHFSMQHMRFFRVTEASMDQSQLAQIGAIVRNVLTNLSPSGELLVAEDSVLEIRLTTGMAFVCSGTPGQVSVPAPDGSVDGIASSFARPPARGDRLSALFSDSTGATWLHVQVSAPPVLSGPCGFNPAVETTWSIPTMEPMSLAPGTPVRFTRPFRLSLYRSSDDKWYLGAKDWNDGAERFNTIQPVAGPLLRYDAGSASGLRFAYRDAQGSDLVAPVDLSRVASITVMARTATDSMTTTVRLRNAP